MDADRIRIFKSEVELVLGERTPPHDNSDVWACTIPIEQGELHVYLHNRAKRDILQHAYSTPDYEVGGALVGGLYRYLPDQQQEPQTFVEVIGAIRAFTPQQSLTRVTFGAEAWAEMRRHADQQYPGRRIVGWYHTHPNHGIFLSADDRFIQNNFFPFVGQLALVVDQWRDEGGLFTGCEHTGGGIRQSSLFHWDRQLYHLPEPRSQTRRLVGPVTAPAPHALAAPTAQPLPSYDDTRPASPRTDPAPAQRHKPHAVHQEPPSDWAPWTGALLRVAIFALGVGVFVLLLVVLIGNILARLSATLFTLPNLLLVLALIIVVFVVMLLFTRHDEA